MYQKDYAWDDIIAPELSVTETEKHNVKVSNSNVTVLNRHINCRSSFKK